MPAGSQVYLLTYPIVQWVAGGLLLMPKPDAKQELPSAPLKEPSAAAEPPQADSTGAPPRTLNLDGEVEGEIPNVSGFVRPTFAVP